MGADMCHVVSIGEPVDGNLIPQIRAPPRRLAAAGLDSRAQVSSIFTERVLVVALGGGAELWCRPPV